MDLKDIQELIKFVAKSGATEVDLEIDNIKISIKSPAKKRRGAVEEPVTIIQQAPPATIVSTTDQTTPVSEEASPENDNSNSFKLEVAEKTIFTNLVDDIRKSLRYYVKSNNGNSNFNCNNCQKKFK